MGNSTRPLLDKESVSRAEETMIAVRLRYALRILTVGAFLTAGLYVILYFFYARAWQLWIEVLFLGAGLGIVRLGAYWSRRKQYAHAAYALFCGVLVGYGGAPFYDWSVSPFLILSGVAMAALLGVALLPRTWRVWTAILFCYGVVMLILEIVSPFQRFSFQDAPLLTYVSISVALILLLGLVIVLLQMLQMRSIRTRLIVTVVIMVLLPMMTVAAITTIAGFQNGRSMTFARLDVEARAKERELDAWYGEVQRGMQLALRGRSGDYALYILRCYQRQAYAGDALPVGLEMAFVEPLEQLLQTYLQDARYFDDFVVLDLRGKAVSSTNYAYRGQVYSDAPYFVEGVKGFYLDLVSRGGGHLSAVAALPIYDTAAGADAPLVGLLVGYVDADSLRQIVMQQSVRRDTVRTYLVTSDYVAFGYTPYADQNNRVSSLGVDLAVGLHTSGFGVYEVGGRSVLGVYRWLPDLRVGLLAEQFRSEAYQGLYALLILAGTLVVIYSLLVALAAYFVTRSLSEPIVQLSEIASKISAGELDLVANIQRTDELGMLARSFNRMTDRLRETIGRLEERVAERTIALGRRSRQLEAAAEVSRQVASVRTVQPLLQLAAQQIGAQFGFYHVGIFMVDSSRRYVVLRAVSSEEGQKLLENGQRLVAGEGRVGSVVESGNARLALDVAAAGRADADYLPQTRSAIGLPLRVRGGEIIGVLDVQSTEENAFSNEDVTILQTMTDQVALAIDNARLLAEADATLGQLTRLLQAQSREGWEQLAADRPHWGYLYDGFELDTLAGLPDSTAVYDLTLPLRVREQPIGTVKALFADHKITPRERELAESLIQQAEQALESAQIFNDSQTTLQEVSILYSASRKIGEARTPQEVLNVFVHSLIASGIDRCVLSLIEDSESQGEFVVAYLVATWDKRGASAPHVPRWTSSSMPILSRSLTTTLVVQDAQRDPQLDEVTRQVFTETLRVQSFIVIPFIASGQLLGWLFAEAVDSLYEFSDREVRLYRALAGQAALALQGMHLLSDATERAERERRVVDIVNQVRAASADIDSVLQTTIRELGRELRAVGSIVLRPSEWRESGAVPKERGEDAYTKE